MKRGSGKITTYILRCNGPDCRQDIDNRHKRRPHNCPQINWEACPTQMERSRLHLPIQHLANNGDAIAPIERDSSEVEDRTNGRITPEPNKIDQHAQRAEDPDRIQRGIRPLPDLDPNPTKREHLIPGKRPHRAPPGLNRRHGGKIRDEAGHDDEEDAAAAADDVIEDLGDGLVDDVFECGGGIAGAVGQYDGVEPAADPGEAEGDSDGPRGFGFGVFDFFGDVGGGVVVGLGGSQY